MTTVVGVDFSGHREDRNTWVARGRLDTGGALRLDSVQPARRADLFELLAAVPAPAVAALDFPFGVPSDFVAHLSPKSTPSAMPDVWEIVSGMTAAEFLEARGRFVAEHGELKRSGDARHFPESYSPLHVANPNMVPMTYEGIRLLHRWHENDPRRWHVPPLEPPARPARTVTLLELMPGAFLKAVGLPWKGYKKDRERHAIDLEHLPFPPGHVVRILLRGHLVLGLAAEDLAVGGNHESDVQDAFGTVPVHRDDDGDAVCRRELANALPSIGETDRIVRLHREVLPAQTRHEALGETDDVRPAFGRLGDEALDPGHGGVDRAGDGRGGECNPQRCGHRVPAQENRRECRPEPSL